MQRTQTALHLVERVLKMLYLFWFRCRLFVSCKNNSTQNGNGQVNIGYAAT